MFYQVQLLILHVLTDVYLPGIFLICFVEWEKVQKLRAERKYIQVLLQTVKLKLKLTSSTLKLIPVPIVFVY